MILDEIVVQKQIEVLQLLGDHSEAELRARALESPPPRDFARALRAPAGQIRLIAEIKRKSPSKGVFKENIDAAQLAQVYAEGGAACLSVLTDEQFFMGSLGDLRAARSAVSLPCLRKDFIVDEAQIYEARAAGADAILLIAAILEDTQLRTFHALAQQLGMAALIEIHDEAELERVAPLEPRLLGINNRDLKTFHTDLAVSERLLKLIPRECTVVAESGIHTRADVARLQRAGASAILVGESLVMARDTRAQMRALLGG